MVMTPFDNCFSAGMCLRFEMRYMPTGSVLQVFLQNVMCCSASGWGYVNIGKPVSYDGYVHVLCFI